MASLRRFSSLLFPLALVALGPSCADEEDGFSGGGSEGGANVGGQPLEGGGGSPLIGGMGGGVIEEGGSAPGGGPQGGTAEGGGGEGGSGVDPDLYPYETEDNGALADANILPDDALGFQGELSDINDIDSYSVFVPLGATFRAAISDGMGGCPSGANLTLQVFSPSNLEIGSLSGSCPFLDGTNNADLASVEQEGTYFVRISATGNPPAPVPFYVLEIDVAPPVCGDGIEQLGEQCDDGNATAADGCEPDCTQTPVCGDGTVQTGEECDDGDMTAGDGCDGTCQLEGDYCPEAEPNNSIATATQITTCTGGYGQISVVADVDYFRVPVTVDGSNIRVEVVDVTGTGCPTSFDSFIALYSPGGAELGTDDDSGPAGGCSLIDPATASFATNLAPGDYYVSVEEYFNDETDAPYVVLISVLAPGCGDAILQSGEECDDGNVVDGDGCDSGCVVEGNYCGELEPNGTTMAATPLAGCIGGFGAIQPVDDRDFFSIDVTVASSSIRIETTGTNGTTCSNLDTVVHLYDPAGVELGSDDQDGIDPGCSLITPTTDVFARNLAVGTYFISVNESGNNATTGAWLLDVQVNPPGCGDGVAQPAEECDDGNLTNGDGCSATCELEGNFCIETEPNDTFNQATSIAGCDGGAGQINYVTDDDWYTFQVPTAGSSVRIEVTDAIGTACPTNFDSFIRLYGNNMMQLGFDNDDSLFGNCSLINPATDSFATNLPAGTYYVRVEENGNDTTSLPYVVNVEILAPGCGDGVPQIGEECDDGNAATGDGCDPACTLEVGYCSEVEPNETTATATDANGCTFMFASIGMVNDQDYFSVDVPAGADLRVETYGASSTLCPGVDTLLKVYDSAGTEIGDNDDGGDGACSLIDPAVDAFAQNLAAGVYYIRMHEYSDDSTTPPMRINIQVLP